MTSHAREAAEGCGVIWYVPEGAESSELVASMEEWADISCEIAVEILPEWTGDTPDTQGS